MDDVAKIDAGECLEVSPLGTLQFFGPVQKRRSTEATRLTSSSITGRYDRDETHSRGKEYSVTISPLIAAGVMASTAATDAVYVLFNAAVADRRRTLAATWSGIWYLLAAFAVISYTNNAAYVVFAAAGSWIGAFCALTWLGPADEDL